jgi:hypothetical protein
VGHIFPHAAGAALGTPGAARRPKDDLPLQAAQQVSGAGAR